MTEADAGARPASQPDPKPEAPASTPEAKAARSDADASQTDRDPSGSAPASGGEGGEGGETGDGGAPRPRRRGSRGGRNRNRPRPEGVDAGEGPGGDEGDEGGEGAAGPKADASRRQDRSSSGPKVDPAEKAAGGGTPTDSAPTESAPAAGPATKPKIGDSRPAPAPAANGGPAGSGGGGQPADGGEGGAATPAKRRRRRGGRGRGASGGSQGGAGQGGGSGQGGRPNQGGGNRGGGRGGSTPVTAITDDEPVDLDESTLKKRRGRERKGKPVGRYLMAVHVQPKATQIAVLEGRSLIEHYVSRPADEISQIHGNIYLGRVQNVLPGMEAAFVDIGTPKNAVLYRGDTRNDADDLDVKGNDVRIEQLLKPRQTILCQVTKNPIGAKGARLTQEISLPGRFVVLVPNSTTYGISKRLPDNERKRLRGILDAAKPKGHGLIVRTAAEGISAQELQRDVARLAEQWNQIEALAAASNGPTLLYRDPDMSIRVIREEFNQDYRQIVIDDEAVYEQVRDYVRSISPALVERVERYDPAEHGGLPIYETFHVHEQLHKAIDRKVWLPSGGSLIIERTEALTVIDVNTGKNVGKSSLEETVFRNNLEAAEEVARQLRLRDIGGIIVIDFIDMEIRQNREKVIATFREALARDKTRTQVFDISELGLVEMTRKRIGEGLIESLSTACPTCEGRGMVFDKDLIGD
jgi:ribonuclease E